MSKAGKLNRSYLELEDDKSVEELDLLYAEHDVHHDLEAGEQQEWSCIVY